jgi:hypothetical protein
MLGVFRMLFDGSARPSKSSAARRANGIFRENLSQCIRELLIKCRNLGATGHVFIAFPEAQDRTLYRLRFGPGQWFAEFVATFGLLLTILGCVARTPATTPYAIRLYITSAYWFTASTSFANPAVAIARSFSDTFAGTDGSVILSASCEHEPQTMHDRGYAAIREPARTSHVSPLERSGCPTGTGQRCNRPL